MKAIIIDDEAQARTTLQAMLSAFCPQVEIAGVAENGYEGLKKIREVKPDIIFIDINMPILDGLQAIELLDHEQFHIIFITASPDYALQAIKFMPYDYLLKPVHPDDLIAAVEKIFRHRNEKAVPSKEEPVKSRILVQTAGEKLLIDSEEILYAKADGSYSHIFFSNGRSMLVSYHLKWLEELLPSNDFFRCHHSILVNLNAVKKIIHSDGNMLELINGSKVEVSRRKKAELEQRLTGKH